MNAHQEKIIELRADLEKVTAHKIGEFGEETQTWKRGKRVEYESLCLRIRQAFEASEACETAKMLLR